MIDDLVEDGIDEKEAVSKLGSMNEILANINGQEVNEIKKMKKSTSITISVLLILGFPLWGALAAATAMLLLSMFIVIWCVPFVTVVIGISGFIGFTIGLIGSFILLTQSLSLGLVQLGATALLGAVSIIGFYLTYSLYGDFMKYSKKVCYDIKKWSLDILRKVGIVC